MAKFIEVDGSGRICGFVEVNDPIGDTMRLYAENPRFIEGEADPATHYIKDGRIVERHCMPISVSGARITGIPSGSILVLGKQAFEVNDGEAEIDGYTGIVKITCWPYRDAEMAL